MAIKVRLKTLKNGNPEIIHPETDWSIVLNRPSITVGIDGETWSKSGSSIRLAANNIYVKDYNYNSEVLLEDHPVKWSVVKNRPSITVGGNGETWGTSSSSIRLYGDKIRVKDYNCSETLLEDYPIKWSAISGRPDYLPENQTYITFGHYVKDASPGGSGTTRIVKITYPALRQCTYTLYGSGPATYAYICKYYDVEKASWEPLSNEHFIPGL